MRHYSSMEAICGILCSIPLHTQAQSTFQNLDFESPINLPALGSPTSAVFPYPIADLFPGWTCYINTNQTTIGMYNGVSLGMALASLVTGNQPYALLDGKYSATLDTGEDQFGTTTNAVSVSLAQIGTVPADAKSLRFLASGDLYTGSFSISFDGQNLPYVALSGATNLYGTSISQFAGETGELRFTEAPNFFYFETAFLDDIQFSPTVLPEPDGLCLAAMGALFFGWKRRGIKSLMVRSR